MARKNPSSRGCGGRVRLQRSGRSISFSPENTLTHLVLRARWCGAGRVATTTPCARGRLRRRQVRQAVSEPPSTPVRSVDLASVLKVARIKNWIKNSKWQFDEAKAEQKSPVARGRSVPRRPMGQSWCGLRTETVCRAGLRVCDVVLQSKSQCTKEQATAEKVANNIDRSEEESPTTTKKGYHQEYAYYVLSYGIIYIKF